MIKPGVDLNGIKPVMAIAYTIANQVYVERGFICTITSGRDGNHMPGSLHNAGLAIDIRTRNIDSLQDKRYMRDEIARRLGDQFDVVLESDHIHIEFDSRAKK